MKVAFYNHTSDISGAEISLLLTMKHLQQAEPVLFAPSGELTERAAEFGIQTVPLESYRARLSRNPLKLLKDIGGMMKSGWRLAHAIRNERVEAIHANSLRAGMMASLFVWLHRRPVIWHVRDIPPGGMIGRMINWLAAPTVTAIIGISKPVLEGFPLKILQKRLHLAHNGVEIEDLSELERARCRQQIRKEWQTSQESKVMVIIGQVAPWKRQEDAIAAAERLIWEGQDVYLWVVGAPKFRQENIDYFRDLRERVAEAGLLDRIRFTGFREDVTAICCAADLLLLCSDNEPFGRVITEAMAQGVPVVGTRAGGVPEIIRHGEDGLLYETGDVDELVACATQLLRDSTTRRVMGKKAAERVRSTFTIERTAARIEEIYGTVLKNSFNRRISSAPRVAIVHDYLNQMGGAERVVGTLHRMYPEAPIFTTIVDREKLLPELQNATIHSTWMQHIPGIQKRFKLFFWLYPLAMRSMKLDDYDLVISSSSAYGKAAPVRKGALHLCYCHTPMRFAWDFDTYMEGMRVSPVLKMAARMLVMPLRLWDRATSKRVDRIVANSTIVSERIKAHYNREAPILYPPVNLSRYEPSGEPPGDYFLVVSRLVSYKRIDLAVEACSALSMPLVVIGDGPDRARLEELAAPCVRFMGRLPDAEVRQWMQGCRAFLFPGLEDFGITPLEVNSCGRPVIAYQGGGALDTIKPGVNGQYFTEQTVESLADVLKRFDEKLFDEVLVRKHAEQFDESRFIRQLSQMIDQMHRTPKPVTGFENESHPVRANA
ncbi:glycosyltransferase family 4 protein [Paenibacillus daejeonensis]|uniref:glycosyltransferase family 4 protein n=1 Tax=Paenibacillus daejeonensis TaxID=135193 RepID=UPI000360DE67|nr:glycosyltransferase [Paenibacillus daejeonensis]